MHLDVIVEMEKPAEQRVVQRLSERARVIRAREIGAADGADEQRIAREHAHGMAWLFDEDRDVLERVSRRVEQPEADVADSERVAVGGFPKRELQIRARSRDDGGAEARELARAGDEVRVSVRFDRERNRQALALRGARIHVDVAPGIDDRGFPCPIRGDEVGALREPFVREPLKHEVRSRRSES